MTLLPVIILIPLCSSILEWMLIRSKSKFPWIIPLISTLLSTALSVFFIIKPPAPYELPWITSWNINMSFALTETSMLFLATNTVAFLIVTILSLNTKKQGVFWLMTLLLQVTIYMFLISSDLAIKVLSWELSWLPMFIILANTNKDHYSIKFSTSWALPQTLLIGAMVIVVGRFERYHHIAFWLMLGGSLLRIYLFPLSSIAKKLAEGFETEVSTLTTIILPLMSTVFLLDTIKPLFAELIKNNSNIISIFICASVLIWLIRFTASKTTSMIYASNIFVFNCLAFIWLLDPSDQKMHICIQMIIIKTFLNIAVTYYGNNTGKDMNKWLFILITLVSMGLPSAKLFSPITLPLLFLVFAITGIKFGKLFRCGGEQ